MKKQIQILGFVGVMAIAFLLLVGFTVNPTAFFGVPFIFGAVKVRDGMDKVRTLKMAHTGATVKDTIYLLGGRPMLAVNSADANADNVFVCEGLIEYAKVSAQAWAVGQTIYWDDTAKNFTTTSTSNTKAGIAAEPAVNPSSTGMILLMPQLTA